MVSPLPKPVAIPIEAKRIEEISIRQHFNFLPPSADSMIRLPVAPCVDRLISPHNLTALQTSSSGSLPVQNSTLLRYTPQYIQHMPNTAYFAAAHNRLLASPYYSYAGQQPNQGVLSAHQLRLTGQPVHILQHLLHGPHSIANASPTTPSLGILSPLEHQHQQIPQFTPMHKNSSQSLPSLPKTYNLTGCTDVGVLQNPPQVQDLGNSLMQSHFIQTPSAQMPPTILNYGNQVMSNAYYYGVPGVEPAASEYFPPQYVPLAGVISYSYPGQKSRRFRRRYHQIYRKYKCLHENCTKSYGSLNHLNTHIVTKNHGQRMSKAQFKKLMQTNDNCFNKCHARSASDSACLSPDGSDSVCSVDDGTNCCEDTIKKSDMTDRLPLISAMVNKL